MIRVKHKKAKDNDAGTAKDLVEARPLEQRHIWSKGLVGSTYTKDKLDSITIWLKLACSGNWSTKSIEDNRVGDYVYQ